MIGSLQRARALNVCFVSSYPPNHARLSEYGEALVNALLKNKHIQRVHVIADVAKNALPKQIKGKLEINRVWKQDNVLSIINIAKHVRNIRPHVVHFNCYYKSFGSSRITNFVALLLPLIFRLFKFKTVVTFHNFAEKVNLDKCGFKITSLDRFGLFLITRLVLFASKVTVTIPSYVNYIKARYGINAVYIPHGSWNNLCPNKNFVLENPLKILMFGHQSPSKGAEILIEAAKSLKQEGINLKLIIAGDENPNFKGYLSRLKRLSSDPDIIFTGYVKEEDVSGLFNEANIVVLPYLTCLGTSGVFHLACSYGKPIISSDLPEIKELISEGASAILVPPNDSTELKKAIRYTLEHPELMLNMVNKNCNFAEKQTWDKLSDIFGKLYWNLCKTYAREE